MSTVTSLYFQALDMNKKTFKAGLFDIAYYTLLCALNCAKLMEDSEPLLNVAKLAEEQLAWINLNRPEYAHSTSSAAGRGTNVSIFSMLSHQALIVVSLRELDGHKKYL